MTIAVENTDVMPTALIRESFPALRRSHGGLPVAYFDGPGGTQVPRLVADAITKYLLHHNANTHWVYPSSVETDTLIASSRAVVADLLNASPDEVSFGNNMTTLTFHLSRALGRYWGPGDEVVVTELDHQANVAPWRRLEKERGITIKVARFDPKTGALDESHLAEVLTAKTRLLAFGAASNAIGTVNDIQRLVGMAQAVGALTFVDAVHYAAHGVIDVAKWDCDFLACSPYKFYGPHAGVLYARRALGQRLDVPRLQPAPNTMPERLETGTQNHEAMVGTATAVEFLASLTTTGTMRERLVAVMGELHHRGDTLAKRLWEGLGRIPAVRRFGPPPGNPRTPTIAFVIDGMAASDVATMLAQRAIFVSHGDFYATTVIERLGLGEEGVVRAGCACYTTVEEVDRLLQGVNDIANG